jgi:hypothetical protein
MLSPTWIMMLLHSQVGLSLYVTLKRTFQKLKGPWRILHHVEGEYLEHAWTSRPTPVSPKRKLLGFSHSWLETSRLLVNPNVVGWNISGYRRVHQKSCCVYIYIYLHTHTHTHIYIYIYPKLYNINLHNVTRSLISRNLGIRCLKFKSFIDVRRERMFEVLIVTFLSLMSWDLP